MMHCELIIVTKDNNQEYAHVYEMAGQNTDRAIEYAQKTCRRRWVGVSWFNHMQVWIDINGAGIRHVCDIYLETSTLVTGGDSGSQG